MPKFDLEIKGQGQSVKITFKAPSKGYVYLFFEENSPSSFWDIEKKLKVTPMLVWPLGYNQSWKVMYA